jgi:hypothetical protein
LFQNFEDFVVDHFVTRAHDILGACKAYMEGTRVGSFVKGGGVQVVHKSEQLLIYENFKDELSRHMKELVTLFSRIGVKDCEQFLSYRRPKPHVEIQDEDFPGLYSNHEMVELLTGGRKRRRHRAQFF